MAALSRDVPAVAPAVVRVLGLAPAGGPAPALRPDTPLAGLGMDSLALLCVADALAEDGWLLDLNAARAAVTIGELADCCAPEGHS